MNQNVGDQAKAAMGNWADMQKRMWDDWVSMLSSLPGAKGAADAAVPAELLKKGVETAKTGSNEAARALMDKISASQGAMNRAMDFFLKSWKAVAPALDANKDWRPDLQNFATNWAQEATTLFQRGMGIPTHLGDIGRSMVQDWPGAMAPWLGFLQQAGSVGQFGEAMLGGTAGLTRLLAMESDASALAGVGEVPRFGVSREKNAKYLRLADAAVNLRQHSIKFHTSFAQALAKAVEATIERLGELAAKGEKITSVRELMQLWFRTADSSLLLTFNSKEFIDMQNDFTRAGLGFRIRQREVLEDVLRSLDLPTRTELDDAYKVIHELKKEVRTLRKHAGSVLEDVAPKHTGAKGSAKARAKAS